MIHTKIQLDPTAQIHVREGKDGQIEIVALDPTGESSAVIEISPDQLKTIAASAR